MCGRFALTADSADLQDVFPEFSFPTQAAPRFNIAPSQPILAVPNDGKKKADFFVWGLVPSWAKDPTIGARMINARAETLAEKPAFRGAYKYHRCVIFADGFFEWQPQPGSKSKVPHFIHLKSGRPFAFAGLWDRWQSPDGSEILSATIITTEPNELMSSIHNRMPVILSKDAYAQWLDPAPQPTSRFENLLGPYPAAEMEAFPVSTLVNSPANDRPETIQPA
ncbi:MAG TPA: SOS response-associated peptidase [Anaerolineales bacterium]|nr:SOS response-associated peptidase [Anaerolineales bacterium]